MRRIAGDLDKSLCLRYGGTAEEREVFDFGDAEKLKLRLLDENDDVIQSTLATPQPGNPAFKTTFEKNSLQWVQEIPKALSACSFTAEFDGTEPRDFYSIEAAIYAGTFDNSDDVAQVTFTHDELVDQGYTVNLKVTQSLD